MITMRKSVKKPEDPMLNTDYARNLLLREVQFQFITMDMLSKAGVGLYKEKPFRYPDDDFKTVDGWRQGIERVLKERYDELAGNLFYEKIVSNVSHRYKNDKIVLPRFMYRFEGQRIRKLDVGPSIGLGPKKLLLNEPFAPVTAKLEGSENEELNRQLTEGVNKNISPTRQIEFEKIVGFDMYVSQNHIARTLAHSFYPGEYYEFSQPHDAVNNPNRLDEFNRLARQDVPGYETHMGDFTNREDIERFKRENPGLKFHNISFYTVAYMFSETEMMAAIEHATELLEDGGVITIVDRVKADPTNNKTGLCFANGWNEDWVYGVTIIDPSEGGVPYDFLRWRTPRCNELMFVKH
jgi:hypothetical protein